MILGRHISFGGPITFFVVMALFLVIHLFSPSPAHAGEAGDQVSGILRGLQERYAGLPGLSMPYERDIMTKSMALLGEDMRQDLATGRIFFKPPHFFRLQQETPRPETVISDGRTVWWYIPQEKTAYKYPSQKLGQELKLLSDIFKGLKNVREGFKVILDDPEMKGEHRIKLIPNPPWPDIDHIMISVEEKDFVIKSVAIYNLIGGRTRFVFGNLLVEEGFEEQFFEFDVPEDVRVIEEKT